MTEATQLRPTSRSRTQLDLHYQIAMPQPESHLFEVTLQIKGWDADVLDLKMPVWTPGSYLVREYARHLQDFKAEGKQSLTWRKLSKNHWQIDTSHLSEITVRYRIFANELTVRTNHLDATHGYFNPAALCFYIPGFEKNLIRITIAPPHADWQVATPLEAIAGEPNTFVAADFDTLVDSPFEIGRHQLYEFEVLQKPHALAVWGQGSLDADQVIADTQKIIAVEASMFGGLPYDRYLFLLHLSSQGFGGLEHKTSCTLNYSRFGFRSQDKYNRFMQLVAHEFFHLWNVKRIRPKALEVFDYDNENYTPSLWFSEGTTSYYDLNIPFRAGIYNAQTFIRALSKEITRFLTTPGRRVQPLSESSFDAWIKLYRRDAYSDNSQMSYYLKGEMVSFLLDLLIRERHGNERSLDDVMRRMWHQFGQVEIGFTADELQGVIESVADKSLSDFFHRYLHTVEELPFNDYLEPFGLQLVADKVDHQPPFVGMTVKTEHGREAIKFVESGSPAHQAGIDIGDELLALNGLRVSADQWSDRLSDYAPGDTIELTVFHQDELRTYSVTLAEPRPTNYQIVPVDRPTPVQEQNCAGWLGCSLASLR
ncbi:M61 family metallopeptidase [Oscillatoria sp. FACHB-1407]|uniref:M61 family metallopeptidase n=1 Tax=Oscillatoria sp. FACHB-1407 TaxID=2692847 RepID=UPI00168509E0|nr:M61 family metallopeptidase [Oscillatoria sp. FACHB-1407]MBD2464328.1 M61 family metallopeptidase [Oscillatoria sp. FACHB-1407]